MARSVVVDLVITYFVVSFGSLNVNRFSTPYATRRGQGVFTHEQGQRPSWHGYLQTELSRCLSCYFQYGSEPVDGLLCTRPMHPRSQWSH